MKKIISFALISLILLSTFSMFAPQAKAEPDYQLTTDPLPEGEPSWSPDGTKIAYVYYTGGWYKYIYAMNDDGTGQTQLTPPNVLDHKPAFSPDGTKIAFQRWGFRGDYWDLMIMDADGSNVQRITNMESIPGMKKGSFECPKWSEDGTKFVFQYKEGTTAGTGPHWVCTMNIDGSGVECLNVRGMFPRFCCDDTKIIFSTDHQYEDEYIVLMNEDGTGMQVLTDGPRDAHPDMSSTSNRIIFTRGYPEGGCDLYVMNEDGSGLEPLTTDGMANGNGEWSHDEKYIVYNSDRSGNTDVWKMEAQEELLSLPAGATNSANGRDAETILLSIDVDSETSGGQQVVTASSGETITVTATFQVWSSGGPGIIKQAFFIV